MPCANFLFCGNGVANGMTASGFRTKVSVIFLIVIGMMTGIAPLVLGQTSDHALAATKDSVVAKDDSPAEMQDIRDIRDPVAIRSWWKILAIGIGVTGILLALGLMVYRFLKNRKLQNLPQPVSPYERALENLRQTEPLMKPEHDKTFSSAVSDVLRHYLEEQLNVPAPGRTTEEFLNEVVGNPVIDERLRSLLAQFLQLCDLVKFAGQSVDERQMRNLYETAEGFIRETFMKIQQQEAAQPIVDATHSKPSTLAQA